MEKKYTNIKERLLYFAKNQSLGIEKFLENIGMTYGGFKGKAKEGSLNSNAIAEIYTKYPDLNIVWLLTGEGSMLKDPIDDIFKNRVSFKTEDERKKELFNSFGDISSGDERLQAMVANLERMNEMLTKENLLQAKVIEGLEFKIDTLEKAIKDSKHTTTEPIIYKNVAEPAPELIKKQHK